MSAHRRSGAKAAAAVDLRAAGSTGQAWASLVKCFLQYWVPQMQRMGRRSSSLQDGRAQCAAPVSARSICGDGPWLAATVVSQHASARVPRLRPRLLALPLFLLAVPAHSQSSVVRTAASHVTNQGPFLRSPHGGTRSSCLRSISHTCFLRSLHPLRALPYATRPKTTRAIARATNMRSLPFLRP